MDEHYALTLFSFGAGQESTYILDRLINDNEFRYRHFKGRILVVGSNTGDEHDYTYEHIEKLKITCKQKGVEFYWLDPEDGFHGNTWQSLLGQYSLNTSIGSAAYQQTCTDNLKVKVVDRFLEWWIKLEYSYTSVNKRSIYNFVEDYGRIRLILGFAKGEEGRTTKGNEHDAVWKQKNVDRYYCLIVDGIDRQACIDYNELNFDYTIFPSNCMRCFYQSLQEILWLYRFHPTKFFEWVELEALKLFKYQILGTIKNYGVYGKISLITKLKKALELYGGWSDEQLIEYKYSHGHCIKSKY